MTVLLTSLGVFLGSAITCAVSPPGLAGYWTAPTLQLVDDQHRPQRTLVCERILAEGIPLGVAVWGCP